MLNELNEIFQNHDWLREIKFQYDAPSLNKEGNLIRVPIKVYMINGIHAQQFINDKIRARFIHENIKQDLFESVLKELNRLIKSMTRRELQELKLNHVFGCINRPEYLK